MSNQNTEILLASKLSDIVTHSRESGEMMQQVTPTTQELLKFRFDPAYCESRPINFHEGQKQAILNTIYCHEILKVENVGDMYDKVSNDLRLEYGKGLEHLEAKRFQYPRYCMKMAT
ncbi:MAG: hypothetical protein K6E76_06690 [Patescibacteria group bacterium]|nr:hypothetical protein [Patescibacteria group bacterium]